MSIVIDVKTGTCGVDGRWLGLATSENELKYLTQQGIRHVGLAFI